MNNELDVELACIAEAVIQELTPTMRLANI
jgi:hypothetical protein